MKRKWSEERRAEQATRMKAIWDRRKKNLPAPVLAEPQTVPGVVPQVGSGEAREGTTTSSDIGRDSRGGQNPLEYLILRHGVDWVTLGADGWEYVGLDNQGNQIFKRKL